MCDSSGNYPSLQVGNYASGCTINCNSGSGSHLFARPSPDSSGPTRSRSSPEPIPGVWCPGASSSGPTVILGPGDYYIGGGRIMHGHLQCIDTVIGRGMPLLQHQGPQRHGVLAGALQYRAELDRQCDLQACSPRLRARARAVSSTRTPASPPRRIAAASSAIPAPTVTARSAAGRGAYVVRKAAAARAIPRSSLTITLGDDTTVNNMNCNYSSLAHDRQSSLTGFMNKRSARTLPPRARRTRKPPPRKRSRAPWRWR